MRRLDILPSAPFFPTASELLRAAECVAPWALGLPVSEDAAGEWAETGRACHRIPELLVDGFAAQAFVESTALKYAWSSVQDAIAVDRSNAKCFEWPDRIRVTVRAEMGVAWRSDGFASEAKFVQRAPGERMRGWFAGTADLVYVRHDGVLVVADWKFGPRTKFVGERAKNHRQGWFLALAFATALEISGSSRDVVVARFEARHVSDSGIEVDGHDITQGELDDWAATLMGLAKRITDGVDAAPRISAACGHCKAKDACPAWTSMTRHVGLEIGGSTAVSLYMPPTSPDDVRVLHRAIEAGEHYVEEWKAWRDAYVLVNGPVSLGMGIQLEAKPTSKRSVVDTPEAMDMIESVAGKAAIVVQRSATCDSIKKAVRDATGEGITSTADRNKAKKAAEEQAFAALIAAGAIRESGKTYSVREVRAGETEE
jgi:Protein of unknown function (DUF2800)